MSQDPWAARTDVDQAPPPPGPGTAYRPPPAPVATGFVTASMGRRLGARVLDGLVVGVPLGVVVGVLAGVAVATTDASGEPSVPALLLLVLVGYVLAPLAAILYEVLMTARGGTLGKRWLGLRVVQRETGQLPGGGPAVLRWLLFFVAGAVVPFVGTVLMALSPFFDSSGLRQGWHDMVARTRVINVDPRLGGRGPVG